MENNIITQFAQVFIHYFSNKSRATTKLFISEPSKNIEKKFGRIFGIVEINTPSKENSKIINQLFGDIENLFYSFHDSGLSPKDAFEKTLKQVNDDFLDIIAQNTTSMVGNLNEYTIKEKINLVIGLIHEQDLVITNLNTVGAFLIHKISQDYKAIEITQKEDIEDDEVKLFHNIITGTISPNDYLLFCNNDFLNFISKERFTKTISSLPPNKAADYFKNSLLQHDGFNFAAIIIKLSQTKESENKEQESLSSINQLNSKESATEKLLSPSILPSIKANGKNLKILAKKVFSKKPNNKEQEVSSSIDEMKQKSNNKSSKKQEQKKSAVYKNAKNTTSNIYKNIKSKLQLNIKYQSFKTYLKLKWNKLISSINKIPNLSKILIIIASISGLLFIYSIYFTNPEALKILTRNKINPQLTELTTTLDEAESKLIFGDNATAKELLSKTENKIKDIKIDNNQDQAYAQDIMNRLNTLVAKLRKITLINDPNLLYDFNEESQINNLIILNDDLYIFNKQNNTVKLLNTRSKEITELAGTIDGVEKSANTENGDIYFSTDKNKFYKIANKTIVNIPITLSPSDQVKDFAFYNKRLYTLIPNKNQIYRHPTSDNTFFSGQTWIQENGINIENTNSINIDTRVWLATDNGKILKFFKGYKQAFSLEEIEPKLENIDSMIKFDESKYIYILDKSNNRIVVFDVDGKLKTQYFSPKLENITSFAVDENKETLYIASGNQIYSIFMNHL